MPSARCRLATVCVTVAAGCGSGHHAAPRGPEDKKLLRQDIVNVSQTRPNVRACTG